MCRIEVEKIVPQYWTEIEGYSSKGQRVKCWLEDNREHKTYLYKVPKIFMKDSPNEFTSQEIWSEFIAYKLGAYLGLNIPKAIPAQYMLKEPYNFGILIENFLNKEISLVEAKQLSYAKYPMTHTLEDIKNFMERYTNSWDDFKNMLIFDCLIGNNDRHDENWGFCLKKNELKLYLSPIYDNASCLTSAMNEENVRNMLQNEKQFNKYLFGKKSRPPNLYLTRTNKENHVHSNHYEIISYLITEEPNMKELITKILDKDYFDYIDDIISNIRNVDLPEEYRISEYRHILIMRILEERYKKLKELL